MERKLNLKKGDKCIVAIEPMSNAARRVDMSLNNIDNWTYEGEVVSIGRKYITVSWGCNKSKFCINSDYREHYISGGSDYKLFKNIQEVYDEREAERLNDDIKNMLGSYGKPVFSLDKLRKIKKILDE